MAFLTDAGELGDLIRAHDWSNSPLGPIDTWPDALRSTLATMLSSPQAMFMAWGPSLVSFFNEPYRPILGAKVEGALGRPFAQLWADVWTDIEPIVARALAGEGSVFTDMPLMMNRYGYEESTWWSFSYMPVRDGDGVIQGMLCVTNETTDRVHAEHALNDLNENLTAQVASRTQDRNSLWELSSDILLRCRLDGIITAVNPAWTTVLGWKEGEVIGRSIYAFIHPDDVAKTRDGASNSAAGRAYARFDNRYLHKEGGYRWVTWSTQPADGVINAVGRDFTAERMKAKALEDAEHALRQAQKMEAVGQLTGGVAHDFNNLLTVIKSSTDLLKRPELSSERRARYVTAISDTVERAAKLTSQLLAFARRQALQPEPIDAAQSVVAIKDMVRTLIGSRVVIQTHLSDQPCHVNADTSQFETALVNMAVNARDAMNGEGLLTVEVKSVEQMFNPRTRDFIVGPYVAVSISDSGSGIPEDHLEQIFEPFFTTKEVGQGTGLGLSQVFGFAKQSGGEITVTSTVGEGSTFTLYLPRIKAFAARTNDVEPEPLVDGHGTCVLVVEDNVDIGAFATQALAELGYLTVWAANAEEALVALAKSPDRFDVVFTDVVMPGMNGIDLAHTISGLYPDLPVLLASGYSHVLVQNGTFGFELLHKPYSIEQLSRLLNTVTNGESRAPTSASGAQTHDGR